MKTIGIVGHRFLNTPQVKAFVYKQCTEILYSFRKIYNISALSAIAEGADSIFADAALALDIPLQVVRPFQNYSQDFTTITKKRLYFRLQSAAVEETRLSYEERSEEAYDEAMKYIVTNSDLLIAVWDSQPPRGKGGTGEAVNYAITHKKNWIHLNVIDLSVQLYCEKNISTCLYEHAK